MSYKIPAVNNSTDYSGQAEAKHKPDNSDNDGDIRHKIANM